MTVAEAETRTRTENSNDWLIIYSRPMPDRRKTLLVVDSDEEVRETLTAVLRRDYRVLRAATGEAALQMMQKEDVDLMLLEVHLHGISGFEVLKIAKENYPYIEIIVISNTKELDIAIEAMRHGAYHYISKDFDNGSIRSVCANAAERQDLNRDVTRLKEEVAEQNDREFVVGPSRSTRTVVELVQKVAKISATVLVLGESGTGKELLARLIHRESGRPSAPFVAVNLAAIPKELAESALFGHEKGAFTGAIRQQLGKFELAAGGTLFLDEIGDLRYELQAKLLRAVQEEEIERVGGTHPIKTDLRLIAATNVDLDKAVKDGRFREDLYYRLNVIPIRMPALRDRLEDLPELARFFLRRYNVKFRKNVQGVAESTLDILSSYWWPGNIRELENLIERLVAVSDKDWITDEDLPYELHVAKLDNQDQVSTENLLERALSTFERNFIVRALEKSSWNVTATSRALGIPLSTLKFKMDKLEIRQLARRIRGN
jgi:two-component system, NtrC family, response regulator PilR